MKKNIYILVVLLTLTGYIGFAQTITTFAGSGTAGYSGDGGQAISATFNGPISVTTDNSGNKYVADVSNNVIRKINTAGVISTVAGNGSFGYLGDGGAATSARLATPVSVVFDASGNMYIADQANNVIRKVTTDGIISTPIGSTSSGHYSGDGGQAIDAQFYFPSGLAFDAIGNLYISDFLNAVVRKVDMSTGIITTIAGSGQNAGYSGDGGLATAALLNGPDGIDIDAQGNIYIADSRNYRIRKINTSGIISTIAGTGDNDYTGDGGLATSATLNTPSGVTIDGAGNIYIADANNHAIREINTAGIMSTLAGNGTAGYSGDGGATTSAQLNLPYGIRLSIDELDNLYVADYGNNVIRKVQLPSSSDGSGSVGGTTTTGSGGSFVTVSPSTATVCAGTGVSLTASGANTYIWSPATGLNTTSGATVTANPGTTTTYTVSGTNTSGSVASKTVTVNVNALPVITISPASPVVLGGQGAIVIASGASTYTWSPSTHLSSTTGATVTAIPQITTGYTVTGTTAAGCVSSAALSVAVELWQQTADTLNAPIYYSGRLGIGTTNPQAALDIVGNAHIAGTIKTDNLTVNSLQGGSQFNFLYVDSAGNLKQIQPIHPTPPNTGVGLPTTVPLCSATQPWMIGGNTMFTITNAVLGTCDNLDLVFEANSNKAIWLKPTGLIGVGPTNSNPAAQLDILTSTPSNTTAFRIHNGVDQDGNDYPVFSINNDGTTIIPSLGTPTALSGTTYHALLVDPSGQLVSSSAIANASGASWVLGGNSVGTAGTLGTTDGDLVLTAGPDIAHTGTGMERMRITSDGNVTITNPSSVNLFQVSSDGVVTITEANGIASAPKDVLVINSQNLGQLFKVLDNGAVYAKEIYVQAPPFPDYVFEKNYKLMSLKEVEKFIQRNKHLPNVISAEEVDKRGGAPLGQLQKANLEKTEELYLYIIELNKKVEKLEEEISKLKNK